MMNSHQNYLGNARSTHAQLMHLLCTDDLNHAGLVSRAFRHLSLHAVFWKRHYSRLMLKLTTQQQHRRAIELQRDKERREKYPHIYGHVVDVDHQTLSVLDDAKEVCFDIIVFVAVCVSDKIFIHVVYEDVLFLRYYAMDRL